MIAFLTHSFFLYVSKEVVLFIGLKTYQRLISFTDLVKVSKSESIAWTGTLCIVMGAGRCTCFVYSGRHVRDRQLSLSLY